ncbi:MAG: hypothetical protein IJW00_09025 [Clostridia bacterium]|nr:hypothetical protein [Clostridia bacterium]
MKRWVKNLCAAVCSFAVLFISIGYAAVSGNLTISGSAEFQMPDIYISNAEVKSGKLTENSKFIYSGTMLNSTANFADDASIVIKIDVVNRTYKNYYYLNTDALTGDGVAGNDMAEWELYTDASCSTLASKSLTTRMLAPSDSDGDGDIDAPTTFYLKITPKADATATDIETYLKLNFGTFSVDIPTADQLPPVNTVPAFDTFANDVLSIPTNKATMDDQMSAGANDNGRNPGDLSSFIAGLLGFELTASDIIAYVPDTYKTSTSSEDDLDDAKSVLDMFEKSNQTSLKLQLTEDGAEEPVNVIIYRTNVDNESDDEYILYLTKDIEKLNETTTVDRSGWSYKYTNEIKVDVMVGVFKSYTDTEGNTKYYQLGDILEGTATVSDYKGYEGAVVSVSKEKLAFTIANLASGSGAFSPPTWKSSDTYYGVVSPSELKPLITAAVAFGNDDTVYTDDSECLAPFMEHYMTAFRILTYKATLNTGDGNTIDLTAENVYDETALANLKALFESINSAIEYTGNYSNLTEAQMTDAILSQIQSSGITQAHLLTYTRLLNIYLNALNTAS